jgi:ferric-dicitrate binding protein FerR (iron transport regulator)
MNNSISQKILFDFFDGKATPLQRQLIEKWLSEKENEEIFYKYLNEWESLHPQFMPDSEQGLASYLTILEGTSASLLRPAQQEAPILPQPSKSVNWWPWAASVVFLLGIIIFWLRKPIFYQSYQTAYGETKRLELEDRTVVTLNANSTLYLPRLGLGKGNRKVILEGEAEFKVTHTQNNQRFMVQTDDDFEVEVLGTEFVVFARERSKRVLLNRGKVKVNYLAEKPLYLQPGELLQYENGSDKPELTKVDKPARYMAWKQHEFYFDNTPLFEVAVLIEEQFGLKVIITDPQIANRRIAGIFKAEKADELLEALQALLKLHIVRKNRSVEIQPLNHQ